jgi:hypothetical protein
MEGVLNLSIFRQKEGESAKDQWVDRKLQLTLPNTNIH